MILMEDDSQESQDLENVKYKKFSLDESVKIEKANDLPIQKRRKMLRHVMMKLYHNIKKIKKKEKGYKEKEIIQEMRLRAYKIISNLVWEKFELRMCEPETQVKIQDIIDFCKDSLKKELHLFEVYTKLYTATFVEKVLLKLSGMPLLGRLFYNKLVEYSYERYDLLLTISDTIGEVLDSHQFLKEEFKNWKDIIKELTLQLNSFEQARMVLFKGNKKLVTAIQTKKAGSTILNYGYHLINKLNHSGEIAELEFKNLKSNLDTIGKKLGRVQYFIKKNTFNKTKKAKKTKTPKDSEHQSLNDSGKPFLLPN